MPELPSLESIICLLQKCRKEGVLRNAIQAYTFICGHGFEAQQAVGNHVIPTLVDCGGICFAERTFQKLAHPNAHAWTSFISGFVDCGKADLSFILYRKMLANNELPSSHTFVALLRACAALHDIERGREIHLEIDQRGFKCDVFVGSALIDMYFKCGVPSQAHEVFDQLPVQDVVVWNTLISGYVEHGFFKEGMLSFGRMREQNCSPNVITYGCTIKAWGNLANMQRGQESHSEIILRAYEKETLLENSLIEFYVKCKYFEEARSLFGNVAVRETVSWNIFITGYLDHGYYEEALKCYYEMHNEGVLPDPVTFVCILKACGGIGRTDDGIVTSALIASLESQEHNFIGNTMVAMYAKCGSLSEAQKAFNEQLCQDTVSWNALIAGYAECGHSDKALQCLTQMQSQNVGQDVSTYVSVLKACSSLQKLDVGMDFHAEISKKGFEMHRFVGTVMIEFYCNCGAIQEAEDTFRRLHGSDVMVWNAMISGYVEHMHFGEGLNCLEQMQSAHVFPDSVTISFCLQACGSIKDIVKGRELHDKAVQVGFEDNIFVGSGLADMYAKCRLLADSQDCFDKLAVQDVAAWNVLIAGYVACECSHKALDCYMKMCKGGVSMNEGTFVCALKACCSLGVTEIGQSIHMQLLKMGFACNPQICNALVDMYAKCGLFLEAYEVFLKLTVKDIISWNTILNGCGLNRDGGMAIQVFEDMLKHGMKPDSITFTCLLTSCTRSSLVVKGQELFRVMIEEFSILPSNYHYNCILDLHTRSGCFHDADKFWQTLPCFPSEVILTVLLDACKNFVKADAGIKYFDKLIQIYSKCTSSYTSIASICANADCGIHRHEGALLVKAFKDNEVVKSKDIMIAICP